MQPPQDQVADLPADARTSGSSRRGTNPEGKGSRYAAMLSRLNFNTSQFDYVKDNRIGITIRRLDDLLRRIRLGYWEGII